jgi:uncharacterized protein
VAVATVTRKAVRLRAIAQSLFKPTTLRHAFDRLGFVQADPIRSPARAQDLILRHRVKGYHAGDLERRYAALGLEEDYLYAYGFLTRPVWRLLHPRPTPRLSALEKRVLEMVSEAGDLHPGSLDASRVVNAWGGYSKATTRALEALHHRGLLRVARRERGVRIYQAVAHGDGGEPARPADRLRALVQRMARIFAPSPARTLHALVARYKRLGDPRAMVADLIRSGELEQGRIDGITYLWPPEPCAVRDVPQVVRFLAPFDPVVWDRTRFEHLWGWAYRLEAYTPPAKRVRGYYAMPMLWGDAVIGWTNASVRAGRLDVELGFVGPRPRAPAFRAELDAEIARLGQFLAK